VGDDRREAEQLTAAGQDELLRILGVDGVEHWTRPDVGWSLFAASPSLWILYGPCVEHGAMMTAIALPPGRPVPLGHVRDAEDLRDAIRAQVDISDTDAMALLADYQDARVG
jgi:hypothetical protein